MGKGLETDWIWKRTGKGLERECVWMCKWLEMCASRSDLCNKNFDVLILTVIKSGSGSSCPILFFSLISGRRVRGQCGRRDRGQCGRRDSLSESDGILTHNSFFNTKRSLDGIDGSNGIGHFAVGMFLGYAEGMEKESLSSNCKCNSCLVELVNVFRQLTPRLVTQFKFFSSDWFCDSTAS
jgi:hypothetical protein